MPFIISKLDEAVNWLGQSGLGETCFVYQKKKKFIIIFSAWILGKCFTSQNSSTKSMVSPLSTYALSWNINLGSSPNPECWRHDISVHPSWSRPDCSRATPCHSSIFTGVLSRIASPASLRSVHRSTFANVHSDPSNHSTWFAKDMWRNQELFRRGWWDQFVEGHERAHYLGSEFSFFFVSSERGSLSLGSRFLDRLWVIYDYGYLILPYECHTCGLWLRLV